MKTMKNVNVKIMAVMLITAALFSGCSLNKMVKNYGEGMNYTPKTNPLENHGGEVAVEADGRVSAKYFHRRAIAELTPVLKYEGGEKVLGTVYLRGEKTTGDGQLISRSTPTNFKISDMVAFEDPMKASELVIRGRIYKQGKEAAALTLAERKIADGVINTSQRIDKDEDMALAPHGYEKETLVQKNGSIFFEYMRHNLNMRLALNNKQESKDQLVELADFIKKGWKIKSLEVNAWASPEGEVAYNEKLSENRAKTVETYVNDLFKRLERETKTKIERPATIVSAKGEDFEGFMKALNASNISDKQSIANVINTQLRPAEREKRIKDMTIIYAEIEKILEPLRRGEIVVTCFEPKKTDEEIARLSTADPVQLDVKELLYAATLTEDLQTKLAIYKAAQKQFPQDYRGFNNAAYVNLKLGKAEEAAKDLEKANQLAPNNGMVLNNLGVVAAWANDMENALSYYEAAQAQGTRTNYNVGNLMIKKGDYQAAVTSFAGRTCTHNVALAHLLAGNESAAMTNLECAKESASVAYLKAIIGARRQNNTMVYENLRKAVQLNPAYKAEAAIDREFIRYFNTAEFQEIVR